MVGERDMEFFSYTMRINVCFLPPETGSKSQVTHQVTAATHNHKCIYAFNARVIFI